MQVLIITQSHNILVVVLTVDNWKLGCLSKNKVRCFLKHDHFKLFGPVLWIQGAQIHSNTFFFFFLLWQIGDLSQCGTNTCDVWPLLGIDVSVCYCLRKFFFFFWRDVRLCFYFTGNEYADCPQCLDHGHCVVISLQNSNFQHNITLTSEVIWI